MPQAMQAVYRKITLALSDVAYLRHLKRRLMLIESNLVQHWSRFRTAEKQQKKSYILFNKGITDPYKHNIGQKQLKRFDQWKT